MPAPSGKKAEDYEELPAMQEGEQWVSGTIEGDPFEGMDEDEDDVNASRRWRPVGSPNQTIAGMEGLVGGMDKGDGWVAFGLKRGDADITELNDVWEGDQGTHKTGGSDMDARLRYVRPSPARRSALMFTHVAGVLRH